MIVVTVRSRVKHGCMAEFLTACRELKPKVLAEPGCLAYEHLTAMAWPPGSGAAPDPDCVILVEIWADDAALAAHSGVPHGKAFAERVRPLRESVEVSAARSVLL